MTCRTTGILVLLKRTSRQAQWSNRDLISFWDASCSSLNFKQTGPCSTFNVSHPATIGTRCSEYGETGEQAKRPHTELGLFSILNPGAVGSVVAWQREAGRQQQPRQQTRPGRATPQSTDRPSPLYPLHQQNTASFCLIFPSRKEGAHHTSRNSTLNLASHPSTLHLPHLSPPPHARPHCRGDSNHHHGHHN